MWVCANNAGNRRAGAIRCWLALDAVHNLTRRYTVDGDRIYIGGFSAGGGRALHDVQWFPDVYRGAYSMMCSNLYRNRKNEAGKWERTLLLNERWSKQVPLERLKKELKIVILRGALDPQWTPADGRSEREGLQFDGFERVSFVEVPKTGHALPPAAWFERGLVALEAPPKKPQTDAPAGPAPGPGERADRILATALLYLDEWKGARQRRPESAAESEASARRYLRQILDQYPTTPAAARARTLLEQLDGHPQPGGGDEAARAIARP
jgi:predicted esterase